METAHAPRENRKHAFFRREITSGDEIIFWEAVQDYLLRICSQRGIVIEANVSSNLAIGTLAAHEEHPIFRWMPPNGEDLAPHGKYNRSDLRDGDVRVCVNSDDPGIFNTSLQNEFRLLENAAKKQTSAAQAEQWLERLRLNGIAIFRENYISPFFTVKKHS